MLAEGSRNKWTCTWAGHWVTSRGRRQPTVVRIRLRCDKSAEGIDMLERDTSPKPKTGAGRFLVLAALVLITSTVLYFIDIGELMDPPPPKCDDHAFCNSVGSPLRIMFAFCGLGVFIVVLLATITDREKRTVSVFQHLLIAVAATVPYVVWSLYFAPLMARREWGSYTHVEALEMWLEPPGLRLLIFAFLLALGASLAGEWFVRLGRKMLVDVPDL